MQIKKYERKKTKSIIRYDGTKKQTAITNVKHNIDLHNKFGHYV